MKHRSYSPAPSENEHDISRVLLPDSGSSDDSAGEDDARVSIHNLAGGRTTSKSHGKAPAASFEDWSIFDAAQDGDEDDDSSFIAAHQAASNRKASNLKGKSVKKGGGFQAMGLSASLLKAIARKGYSVPTPIQRKTVPLVMDGADIVGMARTGSGKTAAFVIPMIERLKAHSSKVGARALILSPSRELALQTLKVVKEFGRGTDLRSVLLVGGDSLEDQFGFMTANPDVIVATPGRFLHLQVEMDLDLSSIRYVVFDEADRLFEMGFAVQLTEILHALPTSRQTLLFSATLPRSLVDFAKAGLQEPRLVRLDAESKVSPDLESSFFTVKSVEKEAALLHIVSDVIKIPTGRPEAPAGNTEPRPEGKKRKRDANRLSAMETPTEHSTIVFAATKHHVEYLATLLRLLGFAVSHVYGSLDQTARWMHVQDFRSGATNILVVTDVAARGIDIPVLANVVNYDFPAQPKIFVHRVGRTARAGRRGRSYSLVTVSDAPYLLDLQLFLGRKLVLGHVSGQTVDMARDIVVGGLARDQVGKSHELVTRLLDEETDLAALQSVAARGEKLYARTRRHASAESAKRAKTMTAAQNWTSIHSMFADDLSSLEPARESMLARVSSFRPQETIFEIGKKAHGSEAAEVMRKRRRTIEMRKGSRTKTAKTDLEDPAQYGGAVNDEGAAVDLVDSASASEDEVEVAVSQPASKTRKDGTEVWRDEEHFMGYTPADNNPDEERGYGVHSGSSNPLNFAQAAGKATVDLANDDGGKALGEPTRQSRMRWDKKEKKYVSRANDEDGSRGGSKMIKGESGQKLPASFRGGRFDAWRQSNRIRRLPRIGEAESSSAAAAAPGNGAMGGKRFRHRQERAPKDADKFRDDYHERKRRVAEAKEKRIGRFRDGAGKREIQSVDNVRKQRQLKERRRQKNARPSKRGKTERRDRR
ncbi:MAG: ATP-dependent RNA helicase dbp10 [Lichina confinis]|nr:MAG: ATP-dependent RNA helicase dbp10 [Lichina confinis]